MINKVLKGQEGQNDLIFIGHELMKEGFFHTDQRRESLNYKRFGNFFCLAILMFSFQMYFIHQIILLNTQSLNTALNDDKIDEASTDIFKMFMYTKDQDKIPSVLNFFKENQDDDFDSKFTDKSCDSNAAAETE